MPRRTDEPDVVACGHRCPRRRCQKKLTRERIRSSTAEKHRCQKKDDAHVDFICDHLRPLRMSRKIFHFSVARAKKLWQP